MRFVFALLIASVFATASEALDVESVSFDLDNDGKSDSIVLSIPEHWDEFIEFKQMDVSFANGRHATFKDFDGVSVATGCFHKNLVRQLDDVNLLKSRRLVLMNEKKSRLLFVFGYCYPTSQDIDVYRIDKAGITSILHRSSFWPEKIEDIDKDGVLDVIGRTCVPDVTGLQGDYGTYSPYQAISLGSAPAINEEMTKAYNLKHYYGYIGPECSHDYLVIDVKGQKMIVKEKDAKRLLGR